MAWNADAPEGGRKRLGLYYRIRLDSSLQVHSVVTRVLKHIHTHTHTYPGTSDLRATRETDRHRGSRGVGRGVLSLSHPVGLVDSLSAAELAVLG